MKVKIKKLHDNAVVPKKFYESDFCYDVVATSREEIGEGIWKYGLGWAFQIERNGDSFGCLSLDFRPRSSVWKTGLVLSNCIGTIDESFTGEVSAIFYKVAPGRIYEVGDRIGQIKLGITLPLEFEEVDDLSETERGCGSYGSTGR